MVKIKIWDKAVRQYHWLQLALLGLLWWSAEQQLFGLHMASAFILAAMLLARIFWGFFGSDSAQFRHFVHGPAAVWHWWRAGRPVSAGHNPLAGWMICLLLGLLAAQFISGLFSSDDFMVEGPLAAQVSADWVNFASRWHHRIFDLLLWLIGAHVLAALWHQWQGELVISAMWHGHKLVAAAKPIKLRRSRWFWLVFVLIFSGFLLWQGANIWPQLLADLLGLF